ncbi:MAG: Zn-dependent exopeptidase M28 [Pyrinomonadaceae bacterium]|nr:Zn-dependent exopeptidase M28 [Pyrinomonadaceae bacterium]
MSKGMKNLSNLKRKSLIERLGPTTLCLLGPLLFIACPRSAPPDGGNVGVSTRPSNVSAVIPGAVAFNGERAMEHVRKQVEFGPRPPGSSELEKTREHIVRELESYGLTVWTNEFAASTPVGEKKMINITAEIPGESKDVVILSSHYETKFYKDMHFVGANDPGASVGTLIELGRVLSSNGWKRKFTYWLVFFDGEESFCEGWDDCGKPGEPDNTYGSRHYVSELQNKNQLDRVRALILLDMMGYRDLELGRDTMSTKWLQDIIWQTARDLGHSSVFVERPEGVGGDDHEPFLRAGIDAVDIIQLNSYPYWHKPDDTLDKVSARSMKIVGDVVVASLLRVEQRLLSKTR